MNHEFGAAETFPKPKGKSIHPTSVDFWKSEYYDPGFLTKEIIEVRIGGIPWNKVDSEPKSGEWGFHDETKTIRLGGTTLGGEVIVYVE